jgi:hypothetical protein
MTGEAGGQEALTPILLRLWSEWSDAYRAHREKNPDGCPIQFEQIGPEDWRITEYGEEARRDVLRDKDGRRHVADFVAKANQFRDRPRVRGSGGSEFVSSPKPRTSPVDANVVNWQEGLAAFLPEIAAKIHEAMSRSPASDLVSKNSASQLWGEIVDFAKTLKGMQRVVLEELLKHDGEISRETIDASPDLRSWSQDLNRDESFKSLRTEINKKLKNAGIEARIGVADGSAVRLTIAKAAP